MKLILLLAPAMLLLGSCAKERRGNEAGTEREVDMTFLTAGGKSTRAAIAAEDVLKNITLLVFDGNSASSTFLYSRYAWRTSADGNKFKTTLQIHDGVSIYFAANVQGLLMDLESGGDLVPGTTTWAQARELLTLDTPTGFDLTGKGLPMWGHMYDVDIIDAPDNSLGKINLLRAVASADVTVGATGFTLEKGHLVYAADRGYLAYDPTLLSGLQVTGPQSPSGMATSVDWGKAVASGETAICNYFYMYDNATSLTPSGANRPTRIVLEGVWDDAAGSGATTFYPLSFRDKVKISTDPDPEEFAYVKKQATRNNKYLIVVTGVNGNGWPTLEDAKNADDVNMEYDVIEWDDNTDSSIIIDGSEYIMLQRDRNERRDDRTAVVYRDAGTTDRIVFTTNIPLDKFIMELGGGGDFPDPLDKTSIANNRFRVDIKTEPGVKFFEFTALQAYGTPLNPSTLTVTAGRIKFTIAILQYDSDPKDWKDGGNTDFDFGKQ